MSRYDRSPRAGSDRADLYDEITNKIIAELEAGRAPWVQPWGTSAAKAPLGLPKNASTGRSYSGINVLILWGAVIEHGFPGQGWLTFRQALSLGGNVRKGERGTTVVYADRFTPEDEKRRAREAGEDAHAIPFLKRFTVFNTAQCEGLPDDIATVVPPPPPRLIEPRVEALIKATGVDFRIGGDQAFYVPSQDYAMVPPPMAYFEPINWHRTALHELGHASGHHSRLNRDLTGSFGSKKYAFEEMVAEQISAFSCAALGIVPTVRHADYIGSWLNVMREDSRAIVRAASQASKAADWLLSFLPEDKRQGGHARDCYRQEGGMILLTDELRAQLLANAASATPIMHRSSNSSTRSAPASGWRPNSMPTATSSLAWPISATRNLATSLWRRWPRCACLSDSASSATFSVPATFRFRSGPRLHGKHPSGACDRVLLPGRKSTVFSATSAEFGCLNFETKPLPVRSAGGGFVTIWRNGRIARQGSEENIPPSFRKRSVLTRPAMEDRAMMSPDRLLSMLARMEDALADARRNLALAERALSVRAEGETIRLRPKSRHSHRHMSRWTGADEAEYRRVLDGLVLVAGPDLDRLRRKIDRQETAILALRRKYRVNAERPQRFD